MYKVISLFLFLILIFPSILLAGSRGMSLRFKTSYNQYDLTGMKKLQRYAFDYYTSLNLPVKVVEEFPDYFGLNFNIYIYPESLPPVGFFIDYCSTGGRISVKDYSGEIKFDQIVSAISIGPFFEINLLQLNQNKFILILPFGLVFTKLDQIEYIRLGNNSNKEKVIFTSIAVGLEPQFAYHYQIDRYFLRLSLGYQINTFNALHLKGNSDAKVMVGTGDYIGVQWNGVRVGITAGYDFK
jgi:hypothetical protein